MAKGQQKSNREVRKPKKDKVAPAATSAFGSQVKQVESSKSKPKS